MTEKNAADSVPSRLMFDGNPHPMWFFDVDTLQFLAVNDAAVAHYGYSRAEFLAMTIADIRPVEDMPHLHEALDRAANNPDVDLIEARHRKQDGTLFHVEISSHPVALDGRRARLVMVFDVTGRVRAEEAAREVSQLSEQVIQGAREGVIVYGLDLRFQVWNQFMEQLTGLAASEVLGRHPLELFPFLRGNGVVERLETALTGEIPDRADVAYHYARTGRSGWLSSSIAPLRNTKGEISGVIATLSDITERKQAADELERRNRFVESLLENAPIGFAVNRMNEGTPVFISRNFERIYGVAPGSIGSVADFFDKVYLDPVFRETMRERIMADLASGDPARMRWDDIPITTQSGERKFVSAMNIPLPDQNLMISTVQDVTERKASERALRRLQQAVDTSGESIFITDRDGIIRYVNPAFTTLYGFSAEEVVGKVTPRILKSGHLDASEYARFWHTLLEGHEVHRELLNRRKDGTIVSVEGSASAIVDEAKRITGFLGIQRDASERKKAEQALLASEARYRAVAQSAHDAIVTAGHMGAIVGWNGGAETIFGYTEAEAIGQPLSILMPSRYHAQHVAGWNRVLAGGDQHVIGETVELEGVRKDGSEFPLELSLAQWESAEGVFVTGILRDITPRVREQAALRLQSAALNAAANPMVITDRDGSIEWVNEAFTTVTGYSADEAAGKGLRVLLSSGAHDEPVYARMRETVLAGAVWHGEMTSRRKDGTWYPEDVTMTPVKDACGEVTHCIAITRDLTEEKARHAQFLQAQKMESVGRLAGGIAHDFNNLLTVINNTADMAADNVREDDPIRADLEEIHRAGERAAALTAQLLSFSRKQIMKSDVVHLSTLVADMRPMLERLIGEDIQLVVAPTQGLGSVRADAGQLEQVVMNLVINARDAMPTGGVLMIETRDVDLDEAFVAMHPPLRPGRHVMLVVRDRGVGMDEATRLQIFEPFFTTKGQGQGTGLGLATVYGIVEQSGGGISVESEVGQGTAFTIHLPQVDGEATGARLARTRKAIRGSETILIVEDDPALLRMSTRILRSAGYTVLMAAEGAEALRVLEYHEGPVDLLLTDVVMPGMGGRELAGWLADIRPEIKVLYTSGYTDDAILRHGVLERTAHFISKPYKRTDLMRKVRAVLDGPFTRPVTR